MGGTGGRGTGCMESRHQCGDRQPGVRQRHEEARGWGEVGHGREAGSRLVGEIQGRQAWGKLAGV